MTALRFDGNLETTAKNAPPGANASVLTLPYAVATVYTDATLTTLVPLYADQALSVALPNPLMSDSQGRFGFWANSGYYVYTATDIYGHVVGQYSLSLLSGAQGPPLNGRGAWDPTATYAIGDFVTYNFSSWVSNVAGNINHQPDISPTQWGLLAAQGSGANPQKTIFHTFTASSGAPQTYVYNHGLGTTTPAVSWISSVTPPPPCSYATITDPNSITLTCYGAATITLVVGYANDNINPLSAGLVAHWPMQNFSSGTSLVDTVAANNINSSQAAFTGTSLVFTPSPDMSGNPANSGAYSPGVIFPVLKTLLNGLNPMSFSVGLNPATLTTTTQLTVFSDVIVNASNGMEMQLTSANQIAFVILNNITANLLYVDVLHGFSINTRYAITVTYDGSGFAAGVNLYINGVKKTLTTEVDTFHGTGAVTATQAFCLMASPIAGGLGNSTQGIMDNPMFHNYVLGAAAIAKFASSTPAQLAAL